MQSISSAGVRAWFLLLSGLFKRSRPEPKPVPEWRQAINRKLARRVTHQPTYLRNCIKRVWRWHRYHLPEAAKPSHIKDKEDFIRQAKGAGFYEKLVVSARMQVDG